MTKSNLIKDARNYPGIQIKRSIQTSEKAVLDIERYWKTVYHADSKKLKAGRYEIALPSGRDTVNYTMGDDGRGLLILHKDGTMYQYDVRKIGVGGRLVQTIK